ncbi:peptidase C1 [Caulobacter flavus]|uniref:Peptidase C1 n=1 Tax=Caulobacter flavus TaxID=1679497 RepID=A0A2N5D383_9CAUL|nr:C1 family peptidase [Caulobacter flavus]AYV48966.1 peptidase C1 [Caulobacter flavus]PLR20534.1 peptidase C1 [Caulobacter flavus]
MTGSISVQIDLRNRLGPARDQGRRPTCLAFAASDAHAGLRAPWPPLSCEAAFFHAQRRAKRPSQVGATLPSIIEALAEDGQPLETVWPYLATLPEPWAAPDFNDPVYHCIGAPAAPSWDHLVASLESGRLVLMLMMLSQGFFTPDAFGVVQLHSGPPDPAIRHAVLAVGHGEVGGEPAVLVRNSWGNGWGVDGHAWLPRSYVAASLFGTALFKEKSDVSGDPVAA